MSRVAFSAAGTVLVLFESLWDFMMGCSFLLEVNGRGLLAPVGRVPLFYASVERSVARAAGA